MSSWITGLADKAENILNKIDQNAATALQLPPDGAGPSTLDTMKKSLTSSTQSLKTTLSPVRKVGGTGSSASSVKSESGSLVNNELKNSLNSTKLESLEASNGAVGNTAMTASTNSSNFDPHELAAFKIALSEITAERDELRIRLSELNNDVENLALRQRESELEMLVQHVTEERDKALRELNETQNSNMAYVHSISELETNLAKLQQEYMSTAHKLQMQIKETDQQRTDLQEYRIKAQRALQVKDGLIAELKANGLNGEPNANENETRLIQIEYDTLKQELQHSLDEQQKLRLQIEDHLELTRQQEAAMIAMRENEERLSKELRLAREHSVSCESEHRLVSQELNTLRQQLSNHMAASATRLQEREQQLEQMKRAQLARMNDDSFKSKEDYENRLKALTQSLVERQSVLEGITAERNALRLQYEKVQQQLHQISAKGVDLESQRRGTRNTFLSNSTDDVKAQFPLLMHPNPFDNRVARRVKRAYSSLDSAGIRVGAFLRRYPLMRIGVLVYVALLHIWVMFVLLSTTPN